MSKTKKPKPKYDSSRKREDYTFHPTRRFELIWDPDPGPCYLFALDERQASMLRKMCQVFPKYHWVWGLPSPKREWDAATWQLWNDIEAFVDELEACLVSGCDVNELNKSIRQLTAVIGGQAVDLTQPIPDQVDYSAVGAGMLPTLNEHLSSLGPIPKAGDTIMTSLQKLTGHIDTLPEDLALELGGGSTIQDMIDTLENTDFSSVGVLSNVRDLLEILLFLKLLFGPTFPTKIAFTYWDSIKMGRWQHNSLTLQAYQAIALRGIQHGITPFEDGDGIKSDEEILDELETIPWLAKSAARYFSGSTVQNLEKFAWILGPVSQRIYELIRDTWNYWYEQYINIVGTPQPARTLTGVLTQISQKLVWDQDETPEGDPFTITDFTGLDIGDRLRQLAEKLAQDGVTLEDVLSQLDLSPQIVNNVNVTCSSCGCGGEEPPSGPIIEGDPPADWPEGWEPPTDPDTGAPIGPGEPAYQSRKCKVANMLWEELRGYLVAFQDEDVPATVGFGAGAILLVITQIIKVGVVAAGAGPIGIAVVLVIGGLAGLVLAFYGSTLDLARMIQILDDYQEDLVCALYNASTTDQGHADFRQIMDDNGAQPGDLAMYDALMLYDALNTLFARMTGDDGDVVEAALDGYTGPVDCGKCEEAVPPLFPFDNDLEGWYLLESDPIYPSLPNTNQTLVWQDHAYFPSTGEALASSVDGGSCYISSPVVNYYLDPLQSHTFEWNRKASNVTYKLSLWMSDGSEIVLEQEGTGQPDGVNSHNLDVYHGQTVRTIELSFGAGLGPRDFIIDYINILSV